ncbi:YjgF-like translation initiation inhibitor [Gordoniibacillus kamchatkensis]|uniref:YjgF-like translation initiation inhibitor n=1 Tax=Gordoniibacillus kamchatkensis TaxID=1590651 RepID=A0ABR5AIZ6_9BACL|nr:RidA family protein [Paenibacillus sp. VKM B-2647]KIL40332.1 YjgF-like translation initiation inhibitor [Paenibacillus sp. VKM B-2647]
MSKAYHVSNAPEFPLPFSHAVVAGDFVYVSGQVGVDPQTREVAGTTIEAQTEQCFRNLETILQGVGLTLDHVVKTNAYLLHQSDIPAYNQLYAKIMNQPYPARTTIQCGIAPYLIEVDVVAYIGSTRERA